MLAAAWVKVMRREAPNTKNNVFIDDKSLRSSSRADFELAFKVTDDFDMRCGQKLNIGKVVAFATDPRDRAWLQQWMHGGHKIQEVKEAVSLGHEISVNKRAKRERQHERIDRSRHTLERVANMSAPPGAKRRIVEGKAIPQVVMGATVALIPKTPGDSLAGAALKAAWGRTFLVRAQELAHAVVLNPLRFHPYWASIGECVNAITRSVYKRPAIGEQFKKVCEARSLSAETVKEGPAANLAKAANALGYHLNSNLNLTRDGYEDIPLIGQEPRWVKQRVEEAARDRLVDEVRQRCREGNRGKKTHRMDLEEAIEGDIDFPATKAYPDRKKRSKKAKLPEEGSFAEALEAFVGVAPASDEHKRWWEVLVTGALRTGQRLNSAGIKDRITGEVIPRHCVLCSCGDDETIEHVIWDCQCEEYCQIRRRFNDVLGKVVANTSNQEEKAFLTDPRQWPKCLRTHGLMPRPPDSCIPKVKFACDFETSTRYPLLGSKTWGWIDVLVAPFLCEQEDGRMKAYTDGACKHPGDWRNARGGYGVFFYPLCPWNVGRPLGGLYQGSDRTELRAVVHVLESTPKEARLPHVKSDNKAVVDGFSAIIRSLATGSKRPTFKANRDLWARVAAVLSDRNGDAGCSWTKGHATAAMVEQGRVRKEDKAGNDEADRLAVEGRIAHGGDPQFATDVATRRQVALIVQAMAIQIFCIRSKLRKEMEDQAEGEAVEGGCEDTLLPEPKHVSIDAIFPPRESEGGEAEGRTIEKLIQRFPNAIRENPSGVGGGVRLGPVPHKLCEGKTRWKYPSSWLLPLKWYWENLEFPRHHDHLAEQGVTWIELMLDFEMATRVMLTGAKVTRRGKEREKGPQIGKGYDTVAQRSYNFVSASRRVMAICGGDALPQSTSICTLFAYRGQSRAGHPIRPKLMFPSEVFRELATQSMTYAGRLAPHQPLMGHWKWPPRYVAMPRPLWTGACQSNVGRGNPSGPRPARRLRGKGHLKRASAPPIVIGDRMSDQQLIGELPAKRIRLRGKTTPFIEAGDVHH
jgi:ribonuclease HI